VLKIVILLEDVMFTKKLKHIVKDPIITFKSQNVAIKIVACPHNVAYNKDFSQKKKFIKIKEKREKKRY
jgi:hypothetical protein